MEIDRRPILTRSPLDAPRAPVVGEPPWSVEWGLPGARDEVRAYAARIDDAWREFWRLDVGPWLADHPTTVTEGPFGYPQVHHELAEDESKLHKQMVDDRDGFRAYLAKIGEFDVSGDSPSQAWQTLQLHEVRLGTRRREFGELTKKPLKSPDPGPLELAGGVEQKNPIEGIFASIPSWVPVAVAVAAGGGLILLWGSR